MNQTLARKFRPKQFDEVIEQQVVVRSLQNRIKNNNIHHAYIFSGQFGGGKTSISRIFARALNCKEGPTVKPCDVCLSCIDILRGSSVDVIEIDAASNSGVDNVRESIIENLNKYPARDRYKIIILDEAHQLSITAFNALLKTLEEPPSYTIFILATTAVSKIPETILSRCQNLEFRAISEDAIYESLLVITKAQNITIEDKAARTIARTANGSLRDSQSLLERVINSADDNLSLTYKDACEALGLAEQSFIYQLLYSITEQEGKTFEYVKTFQESGLDFLNISYQLLEAVRGLLVVKVCGFDNAIWVGWRDHFEEVSYLSDVLSEQDLIRFFELIQNDLTKIKQSPNPRFTFEIMLTKLIQIKRLYLLEQSIIQLTNLAKERVN